MTCTLQQNRLENHQIQFNEQIIAIRQCLQNDLKACDIKWSLFVAAAQGFRYESKLKPYPPQFMHNGQLNIDRIQHVIANAPPFSTMHKLLGQQQWDTSFTSDLIVLLHWLLVTLGDPVLKTVPKTEYHEILNRVQSIVRGPEPTYIFECVATPDAVKERNFQQHAKDRSRRFAFHGSKLDSFHSILNYGLQQHLCKEALFGEGIYLSSEMHVSLLYSSIGTGWPKSLCGKNLSCMAVCEFVEHADHLRYRTKESNKSSVPDKYFVITNNEIVCVRYLLIFADDQPNMGDVSVVARHPILNWMHNHKGLVGMAVYAVVLMAIGAANSRNGLYLRHIFWRKAVESLEYLKKSYFEL